MMVRLSQLSVQAAAGGQPETRLRQIAAMAAAAAMPQVRVAMLALMQAYGPPNAKEARAAQLAVLAAGRSDVSARVTQAATLVAYREGVIDASRRMAWTFDFDGHSFYVLDLGTDGTYLFDLTTGTWCEFDTPGYGLWNMRAGTAFNNGVVGGDSIGSFVWQLDPEGMLDEGWRPIAHAVTGLIEIRNRKALRHDSVRLTASAGQLSGMAPDTQVSLRFSDDYGKTWSDYYTLALTPGSFSQEIAWRSLGPIKAPGRVLEISDTAGPVRIDGCDAEIEGLADGEQPGQAPNDHANKSA